HHARAAPDTCVAMQIDDAIVAPVERTRRTDPDARRGVALIAEDREEQPPGRRERPLLDRFHPAAIDADRNVVLRLARDRARMTPDAFSKIDSEPIVRHPDPSEYIK